MQVTIFFFDFMIKGKYCKANFVMSSNQFMHKKRKSHGTEKILKRKDKDQQLEKPQDYLVLSKKNQS